MAKKKNKGKGKGKEKQQNFLEEYAAPLDTGQTRRTGGKVDPKVPHG